MRAHILIHVGGCGVRLGRHLWERLFTEHGVGTDGRQTANAEPDDGSFFVRAGANLVVPRAIVVDSEPSAINELKTWRYGALIRPDNLVFGTGGSGNNWAMGYGLTALREQVMTRVAASVTHQGSPIFILVHSLSGGAGGGLGAAIAERLRELYPSATLACFSVVSDPSRNPVVVLPYNEVLALDKLRRAADMIALLDNKSLAVAAIHEHGQVAITNAVLNQPAARALALLTAPLRLPATRAVELRELARTLSPFAGCSLVSLALEGSPSPPGPDVVDTLQRGYNRLSGHSAADGKLMSPAFIVPKGRALAAPTLRADARLGLPDWLRAPLVLRTRSADPSILMAASDSGVRAPLLALRGRYDALRKRKAFLHWYTAHGVDSMHMAVARASLNELLDAYQQGANQ